MPESKTLKPAHKAVKTYYAALQAFKDQNVDHETGIRSAFQRLLEDAAKTWGWLVVAELSDTAAGKTIRPDATLRDRNNLPRGYWEAKDTRDDLDAEIAKKIKKGYPLSNTIFEDTQKARLFQNGQLKFKTDDLADPQKLCDLLNLFFAYAEPDIEEFEKAVSEFKERVPDLALGLDRKIKDAHRENPNFQETFDAFFALCQKTLNPNLREEAVDEMLVQHLLTERLIRTIFDNPEFTSRNVIAAEVEKVITALVSQSFNRKEFLASLDRFYAAIEAAARRLTDFAEKQHFLNSIYERFFQGYSVKVADTHGIVYTPQPVVDFMCASVAEALKTEFGKTLSDPDVFIIDPCTGTGNFIVNLMRRIPKKNLPDVYKNRLFANEVMLLPYYIASLNIEHAYYELTGTYEPFDGLCFVDTLELAEVIKGQTNLDFMTEKNTERVERQRKSPITVVIGNPPYNIGQLNENDNNKNREYPVIEERIRNTYVKDSKATNKNALSDAYVKFFRWAVDRLEKRDGIVCFISNNGFLNGVAFDGFRKHIVDDFNKIYHFDFKGNARTSEERRRKEGGNIFSDMIRVGVGISLLVRKNSQSDKQVYLHQVGDYLKAGQKKAYLESFKSYTKVDWLQLSPNARNEWITAENDEEFFKLLPLGSKEAKSSRLAEGSTIFNIFSNGVKTNRDAVVYDYDHKALAKRVKQFIEDYNSEVDRYGRSDRKTNIDEFVKYDKIDWSRDLKLDLKRGNYASFDDIKIRTSLYRPFNKRNLFFDRTLNEEIYSLEKFLPSIDAEAENLVISVSGLGSSKPFQVLISNIIPCLDSLEKTQCFPLYRYQDGAKIENISDWGLKEFMGHYQDSKITKLDIFHYVYGILHHPDYREKFSGCLRRSLPHIPFAPDFWAFAKAGKQLADFHLNYEQQEPYPLEWIESDKVPQSLKVVDKMRLSKDRTQVTVNPSLTLAGVPPEAFEYRLGNRSALEWVLDQYQVKKDDRTGVISDPNRYGPDDYIVNLIDRVIAVSLETVKIVKALPEDFGA